MRFDDQTFTRETVELDGNQFVGCIFIDCKLVFSGYEPVTVERCDFNDSEWSFEGPAGNTLDFLSALYQGLGPGGEAIVELIVNGIRDGSFPKSTWQPALAR